MQKMFLLSGYSGSGKTTIAKKLAIEHEAVICSTDDFFIVNGIYTFNPKNLSLNHQLNQNKAIKLLDEGKSVIIDNTNITCAAAKPYVKMAVDRNIPVEFIRATGDYNNVHNVPAHKVQQMKEQLEVLTIESCLAAVTRW